MAVTENKNVNLTTSSPLVALQVVVMTTYGAINDEKVAKLTIFVFSGLV